MQGHAELCSLSGQHALGASGTSETNMGRSISHKTHQWGLGGAGTPLKPLQASKMLCWKSAQPGVSSAASTWPRRKPTAQIDGFVSMKTSGFLIWLFNQQASDSQPTGMPSQAPSPRPASGHSTRA